jgi:hypothetical protein
MVVYPGNEAFPLGNDVQAVRWKRCAQKWL